MASAATELDCDIHLVPFDRDEGCRYCLRFLEEAPDPAQMPTTLRLEELERWLSARRSIPGELYFRRIEALVGRRINLTELNDPDLLMRRAQQPIRQWDWDDW